MTTTPQIKPLLFETPTATLEVMTRSAAISQWSDRPVVQPLRFYLRLTAIAPGSSARVEIQGDRDQLLPLQTAVQDYIQGHLTQMAPPPLVPQTPHLIPAGLLQHRLYLGSLQTTTGDRDITLDSLHLADLGDLFDQLDQQVRILPQPLRAAARPRWRQWQSLAAGLVAAVGVVAIVPHLYPVPSQTSWVPSPQGESENISPTDRALSEESAPQTLEQLQTPPGAVTPEAPEAEDEVIPSPSTGALANGSKTKTPAPTSPPPSGSDRPDPAQTPAPSQTAPRETVQDSQDSGDAAIAQSTPAPLATFEAGNAPARPENAPSGARLAQGDDNPLAVLVGILTERWQPPATLGQSLEYVLDIAPEGTLAGIEPRDDLAVWYQAEANLPELGEALLPPGEAQRLRIVLSPSGTVEVTPFP